MYNTKINESLAKNNSATPEKINIVRGSVKQTTADKMNELAKSVRSGNIDSFDALYNLAYSKAFYIASKEEETRDQADDIAQEAMIRLYQNIDKVEYVTTWLYRTVSNMVTDAKRKKESLPVLEFDAPKVNAKSDAPSLLLSETVGDKSVWVNPEAVLERDSKEEILKNALPHILSLLSDRHQEVICYALIEKKKQSEIASIMGISRSTVAVTLRNATARFQKEFAAHYDVALFGLQSAYELETITVSSSFLAFIKIQKITPYFANRKRVHGKSMYPYFYSIVLFFRSVALVLFKTSVRILVSVKSQSSISLVSQFCKNGFATLISLHSSSSAEHSNTLHIVIKTSILGTVFPLSKWLIWLAPTPISSDNLSWVSPFSIRFCLMRCPISV